VHLFKLTNVPGGETLSILQAGAATSTKAYASCVLKTTDNKLVTLRIQNNNCDGVFDNTEKAAKLLNDNPQNVGKQNVLKIINKCCDVTGEKELILVDSAGRDFATVITDEHVLGKQRLNYLYQIIRGMAQCEAAGVVLECVNPHEIMISKNYNQAIIGDFENSSFADGHAELTESPEFKMIGYMSPESLTFGSTSSAPKILGHDHTFGVSRALTSATDT
jgi:serine/threonine protein kinase